MTLPSGWTSLPLTQLTKPTRPRRDPQQYSNLPFVGMEQIEAHTRRLLGTLPSSSMKSTAFHFEPGDVLYGRLRPYLNKVHCAQFEGLCSSEFIVLPPQPNFDPRYLSFFLNTERFVGFANQLNQGDRPRVNFNQIGAHDIPLPPLNEQKRIVEKLEKLLVRVDAVQERLDKIPAILKRFRQSVLAAACSGKLTADWRFENEESPEEKKQRLDELLSNRLKLAKNQKDADGLRTKFIIRESEKYPIEWATLPAECVCDFITKGTTPKTELITSNGDVPFLKVFHIVENRLDFNSVPCFVPVDVHNNFLKRSKVFPRDVIMNIVGPPLNKVAIIPDDFPEWNINQALAIFRPVQGLLPEFIRIILSNEETIEHVLRETRGIVGQSNISLEQCRNIEIPVPILSEQVEIVGRVEELFKFADAVEERYKKAKAHTDKLTQSILAKAFRGELVPQDPNDEPASVLLERIKSQTSSPAKKRKR